MPRVSITVEGQNPQPYRLDLNQATVQIGRAADNDIVVNCPSVSSYHCTMERVEGGHILRDNNSTNGIRKNDDLMDVIDLVSGQDVLIGDVEFAYALSDDELDELAGEPSVAHGRKKLPGRREEVSPAPASYEVNDLPPVIDEPLTQAPQRTLPPRTKTPVQLSSAKQGPGFFLSLLGLIVAVAAFFAGVNASYNSAEKKKGREEASFIKDLREGREVREDAAAE